MSLNFGIYLVEQRIITPEQFCGLVKIQQESTRTVASIAIAKNFLTMKQVSRIIDIERAEERGFVDIAVDEKLLDRADAMRLSRMQEQSGETIRSLAVECGLLTERQASVLYNHFTRNGSRRVNLNKAAAARMTSHPASVPSAPHHVKAGNSERAGGTAAAASAAIRQTKSQASMKPAAEMSAQAPMPKFKQRPIASTDEAKN